MPAMQHFLRKMHLTKETSEADLIRRSIDGDGRAQKAIFDSLAPKMLALALRYMGERESAEDVLQEGFVTLFSKIGDYSGEGSFEGWARKIFVNTALMSLRKKDALRGSETLAEAESLEGGVPDGMDKMGYKELLGLVAELPGIYRTAFNLFVIEGYSHREIALALGITEATSRSHVQRARAMLKKKIERSRK